MKPLDTTFKAMAHIATWETSLIVHALNYQLNLNELARLELVSRGLNQQGEFIGHHVAQVEYIKELDADFFPQDAHIEEKIAIVNELGAEFSQKVDAG